MFRKNVISNVVSVFLFVYSAKISVNLLMTISFAFYLICTVGIKKGFLKSVRLYIQTQS